MMLVTRLEPVPLMTISLVQTSDGFEEVTATRRFAAGVSASPMVKLTLPTTPFMGIVRSRKSVMVGAAFAPMTVTVNERTTRLFLLSPSSTRTVMVAVPMVFGVGVRERLPEEFGER